jgi:hypothetical protein
VGPIVRFSVAEEEIAEGGGHRDGLSFESIRIVLCCASFSKV